MDSYNTPDFNRLEIHTNQQETGRAIESDKRINTHIKIMK